MTAADRDEILLLGRDFYRYGQYELRTSPDGRTACTISVGADRDSPSRQHKGDPEVPNEDALLSVIEEPGQLVAVADAHWGHEASHVLLERLRQRTRPLPASLPALRDVIAGCTDEDGGQYRSETSLLVAVYDRVTRQGFGVSFGDSTLVLVDAAEARIVSSADMVFVSPRRPASLSSERGAPFSFTGRAGQLLCAFTDGIDGCHYGFPETSVTPPLLAELFGDVGLDAEAYARSLTELALRGIAHHPGGQDNIALIVTLA